jgi:hypothetical protein
MQSVASPKQIKPILYAKVTLFGVLYIAAFLMMG